MYSLHDLIFIVVLKTCGERFQLEMNSTRKYWPPKVESRALSDTIHYYKWSSRSRHPHHKHHKHHKPQHKLRTLNVDNYVVHSIPIQRKKHHSKRGKVWLLKIIALVIEIYDIAIPFYHTLNGLGPDLELSILLSVHNNFSTQQRTVRTAITIIRHPAFNYSWPNRNSGSLNLFSLEELGTWEAPETLWRYIWALLDGTYEDPYLTQPDRWSSQGHIFTIQRCD